VGLQPEAAPALGDFGEKGEENNGEEKRKRAKRLHLLGHVQEKERISASIGGASAKKEGGILCVDGEEGKEKEEGVRDIRADRLANAS